MESAAPLHHSLVTSLVAEQGHSAASARREGGGALVTAPGLKPYSSRLTVVGRDQGIKAKGDSAQIGVKGQNDERT